MRLGKLETLLRVALDMRARPDGISLIDIQTDYGVSRRTAERMRDVIGQVFPDMAQANPGELPKRYRIPSTVLSGLVNFSVEEIASLTTARSIVDRENLAEVSDRLASLSLKLQSLVKPKAALRLAPDIEAIAESEGVALRPGPRPVISPTHISLLRNAMVACRKVTLHYRGRATDTLSRQTVCPYGFLFGNRHYLVAYSTNDAVKDYRLFALANIESIDVKNEPFVRRKDFSLHTYANQAFGVFQEKPFETEWLFTARVAKEARHYLFHPTQVFEETANGSLLVKFRAGGALEMCWHLFSWGDQVRVLKPARLRNLMKSQIALASRGLKRK
jgi:predicted DNA-binding transcriptional regulator YafY